MEQTKERGMLSGMAWISRFTPRPLQRAPFTSRQAQLWSGAVLAYLALAYWLVHYVMPGRFSPDVDVYVVRPAIWGGLGVVSYLLFRRVSERPFAERTFVLLAMLASAFSVSVMFCSGLLFSFGHSPYARDVFHMGENLWYLAVFIFGLEMSRSYLMTVWGKVNATLAFGAIALIYALVWIAPGQYDVLTAGSHDSLQIAGRTFVPGISESVMATFLVALGGPLPAFIYHLSLEGYRWLSPILPNLGWTAAAFIGTVTPAVAMLIVRDAYFGSKAAAADQAEGEEAEAPEATKRGVSPLLLIAGTAIVALIWLQTGMFGVTPYLVSGPSMKPGLGPGDIVLSEDADPASIKIGDIIRFSTPNGDVIHRVVKIESLPQGLTFTTKGDNNNTEDPSITSERIEGRIVSHVPYIGWLPIKIKALLGG